MSPRKKISRPKVKKFVESCLASGMTSPSQMRDAYNKQWKKELTDKAFIMAMNRLGVSSEKRKEIAQEAQKQTATKDISEYRQVQSYETTRLKITEIQKKRMLKSIRKLWEIMGCTNPEEWTYESLLTKLKTIYTVKTDERGREDFEHPLAIQPMLSAFNTMFAGILPEGWYSDFARKAGELKDYLAFEEYAEFKNNLTDTEKMPRLGWTACYDSQINAGCREGTELHTGILSLLWENINYENRRCSIRDKGGRGDAARLWKNVPLDLFPHLNGWNELLEWHRHLFGYIPTNERHAVGRCFNVPYEDYRANFQETRRKCGSRIGQDSETMKPHILRKTHGQWLVKLRVPLERICGQFPNGKYGVGWDNPAIFLKYYGELEDDPELEGKINTRMQQLGLVSAQSPQEPTITPMIEG